MDNDKYGRTVTMEEVGGYDVYTVGDDLFTVKFPAGTPESRAYQAINSMAPADYSIPPFIPSAKYKGGVEFHAPESNPLVDLPEDLTNGSPANYIVGNNEIDLYLNGQRLLLDSDYEEVGDLGTVSSQIQLLISVADEDYIEFQGK